MRATMPHPERVPQRNSVPKTHTFPAPSPIKAHDADGNSVPNAARLLRTAIARTGLNHKEAMDALGVDNKGHFSEMLDGIRKIWLHQLLRPEAAAIRKELLILCAVEDGICEVERVIRLKERA